MTGEYILLLVGILAFGFTLLLLIYVFVSGYKALKRTREAKKAKKCPYYIEGGLLNEEDESKSRSYHNIDS